MILILATDQDEHARAVIDEIAAAGETAELLDLSQLPGQLRLTIGFGGSSRHFAFQRLDTAGGASGTIDLAECRSIWWRRPQTPIISDAITRPSHRLFAMNELHEALAGLWHAVDAFWINDPARDELAHHKVFQLRVAQDVGLAIPRTLITTDPDAARHFIGERPTGATAFKAFSAAEDEWRETRIVGNDELAVLDNVGYAPVIFQEYVEATYDLRITAVGNAIFAAAIHSQQTAYKVDFRMDIINARVESVNLPPPVEAGLRRLMRRLGLVYGAIDMRLTPDGRYVFLEINPAGQWLFVEQHTRQPIAAQMARLLVEQDTSGRTSRRDPRTPRMTG